MARKSFSRRVVRKVKRTLKVDELQNVIEKEFTDSRGNKSKVRFDFNPHNPKEPTVQLYYDYGDDK